jgi:mycofactocin glycosyltransferase
MSDPVGATLIDGTGAGATPVDIDLLINEHNLRWSRLLSLSGQGDLRSSLVTELSRYTGLPPEEVDRRMCRGQEDLVNHWKRLVTDPTSTDQLVAFYNADLTEAYELASWHAGGAGAFPLKYLAALDFATRHRLRTVLDFGSGIGSGTILFAQGGFSVTYADIATPLLDFVSYRLESRGLGARQINLLEASPEQEAYDLICAYDVLEHIPDQLAAIRRLRSYLRPGGWLIANLFPEGSLKDEVPLHISTACDVHQFITNTGLWADWSATSEFYPYRSDGIALHKTWWAPTLNLLRRLWYRVSS